MRIASIEDGSAIQTAEIEEENAMQCKTVTNHVHIFGIVQLLREQWSIGPPYSVCTQKRPR